MASQYLRKYGASTTINFELYKLDGTGLKSDAASATHDIKIMKDEGAEADTAADAFVDEGQGYSLALTATEMTAARVVIYIVDLSSPQVWLDKVLIIESYGHASAQHPFDLGTDKIGTIVNAGGTATIGAILGDFANTTLTARVADLHTDVADVHTDVADVHTDVGTVTTDVAAVHTHVGTIDGHITANYAATEKTCIDLLDDAAGGLADIHTDVADVHTDVGTAITNIGDMHATDLPAVKTDTAAIKVMTDKIGTIVNAGGTATIGAILGDFANSALVTRIAAIKAETALIVADTNELQTDWVNGGRLDLLIDAIKTKTDLTLTVNNILDEALAGHTTADSLALAVKNVLKIEKNKRAIIDTSLIIYDDNGSTALYTFTLDSATAPTSRTPA
jgi:hypothetical protein